MKQFVGRAVTTALLALAAGAAAQGVPAPSRLEAAVPPGVRALPSLPAPLVSRVDVLGNLDLPTLAARRDVRVYLPPSYAGGTRRYPVLYLQDGQTLFGRWDLQNVADTLARSGVELILVAVDHGGTSRTSEYTVTPDPARGGGAGDRYLADLVRTVKPAVDARYRTLADAKHTGVAGTDLGGLISVEAGLRYPNTFGFVGALSPALDWADLSVVRETWKAPRAGQAYYVSVGTREGGTPDADLARIMDAGQLIWALGAQGARVGYLEIEGDGRADTSLRGRLPGLLRGFHSFATN
ncbi:alpha/beta hydrolase [Deinococcus pimensis]|uniref:alpha/beta hydrolase n=1 Tax=Deinococcus pimensis TaxID=309888 RepID=UPI0004AF34D7|nr:alpha/beta hydrolase-fold protein [Deinococcus pimensis]